MPQKFNTSHFDIKKAQKIILCIIDFYMIPTSVSTNKIKTYGYNNVTFNAGC